MDVAAKIHDHVRSRLAEQGITADPGLDEPLLTSGLLDSLFVIETVVFMEKQFGVDFSDVYFDREIFNTINEMAAFVKKRGKATG